MAYEPLKVLEVQGLKIRYMEKGHGDAVVYLHGYSGMDPWFEGLEKLSEIHRVIALEIPGFGESGCPSWVATMDELAFLLVDIFEGLELDRTGVIGSSLGGWLAATFASHYPHLVRKLVLVDSMGLYTPGRTIADIFLISEMEHMRLRYFKPNGDAFLEKETDFLDSARANRATAHLAWNPRFHDPKLRHKLSRVTSPTLIIWGEEDGIVPPFYAYEFQSLIRDADVELVAESGHVPQFEQTGRFSDVVTKFM